ncbi:MAG: hypothetical protein QGF94_02100 [Candidatus Thalassarchaeaceae archaeon]|nr:hypothetical protein [Candidatus Thalassarchaeaceae archaeon]
MSDEDDEERIILDSDDFLSSQVSFDIEAPSKPVRRRQKKEKGDESIHDTDELVTSCPGCGADLPESEFVEAILSFVTGAADYLGGDPVRVRSVQMLQQIISQGRLPDPHSEWSMEVVQRLQQHIEHMADERARLLHRQEIGTIEMGVQMEVENRLRAELAESMRAEIENEIVGEVAVAIRDQVREQTIQEMVPQIRAEIEKEMWEEFEEVMRKERAKNNNSSSNDD